MCSAVVATGERSAAAVSDVATVGEGGTILTGNRLASWTGLAQARAVITYLTVATIGAAGEGGATSIADIAAVVEERAVIAFGWLAGVIAFAQSRV
jgi:hypothetical protein